MAISFRVVASDGGYYGEKDTMFEAEQLKKFCQMHDPNCYIEKHEFESVYEKIVRLEAELDKYKQLEQDGLLKIFPCKVGDTVYPTTKRFGIIKVSVYEIRIDDHGISFLVSGYVPYYSAGVKMDHYYQATFKSKSFGKTVFLTEPDAIKALEGLK